MKKCQFLTDAAATAATCTCVHMYNTHVHSNSPPAMPCSSRQAQRISDSTGSLDQSTNDRELCPFGAGPLQRQTSPSTTSNSGGFLAFCHLCIPRDGINQNPTTLFFCVQLLQHQYYILRRCTLYSYPRIAINSLDRDRAPAHTGAIAIAQDIRSGSCFPLHFSPPPFFLSLPAFRWRELCTLHALVAMPYTYVT